MKPVSEWNLSEGQRRVLDAVIEHGTNKLAARALGISYKTVENQLMKALANADGHGTGGRLHMLLAYDRSKR